MSSEMVPGTFAVIAAVVAFLLGLLIGHSGGARSTARRIAWMILFRESLSISERTKLCDEILEEFKYA